jgi:hypothetical protein
VDFDPGTGVATKSSSGSRDIFVSKIDSSGNLIWNRTNGGLSAEVVTNLTTDDYGYVYSIGYFYSDMDMDPSPSNVEMMYNNGSQDAFFWSLDSSGNYLSAHAIGGSGNDVVHGIDCGNNDDIYIGGTFSNTVDFDPDASNTLLHTSNGNADFLQKK